MKHVRKRTALFYVLRQFDLIYEVERRWHMPELVELM
jgi:hypothetical protein